MITASGAIAFNGIDPDRRCLNACVFCAGICPGGTVSQQWNLAVTEAAALLQQGITNITLSGLDAGEYPKLVEFVRYLIDHGATNIELSTHGRTLRDFAFVKDLKDAGVNAVRIPLYGSTPSIHDRTTRKQGSFFEAVKGIQNCAGVGFDIWGHIIATQYNKEDLNNILNLYISLAEQRIVSLQIVPVFILEKTLAFTRDWFLPTKDMKPYLQEVHLHHPDTPVRIRLLEIPYCVLGGYSDMVDSVVMYGQHEGDLNSRQIRAIVKNEPNKNAPHFRAKMYFSECEQCILRSRCSGLPANDYDLFGAGELKAIRSEACLDSLI